MIPEAPAALSCPECEGRGWVVVADGKAGSARLCDCQKKQRMPRLVAAAGVPPRYADCRLDNFQPVKKHYQVEGARKRAEHYVDSFVTEDGRCERGLLFIGVPGVGKTHLAVAVLLELIRRYGVQGRFVDFTSLLHEIQSTFDNQSSESKQQVLSPVLDAELLVLDELGAQKPSDWVQQTLYLILNHRYTHRLPTLFTTNYRLSGEAQAPLDRGGDSPKDAPKIGLLEHRLQPALLSRLYEMTEIISIDSSDYRQTRALGNKHSWQA